MSAIYSTGVVRNGRVELESPLHWPDGTEVIVTRNASEAAAAIDEAERARIAALTPSDDDLSLIAIDPAREDDDLMTAEEIAATLAAMERIVPAEKSDEERAAWDADRQARREREKAQFQARTQKLERNWE